jgi:hypothetical protein
MLVVVAISLVMLSVVTAASVRPGVHAAIVIVSTLAFGAPLLLIRDLDEPFNGVTARSPAEPARSPLG